MNKCMCLLRYSVPSSFLISSYALVTRHFTYSSPKILRSHGSPAALKLIQNNDIVYRTANDPSPSYFEKHVICPICGRLCSSKSSLLTHIRVHTGEKPFSCDLCGKKFTQKATLQRHRHLHTGEKHFKCDHCSKRFYRKDKLYEHRNVHRYNAN